MTGQSHPPRNIHAEEIFEWTDPGIKIASIHLVSDNGSKATLRGPFSNVEAKEKVLEFREKTRSGIATVHLSFIE